MIKPPLATSNKPCAEIIESSLHSWLAQSWQWNNFIPLGSLITIQSDGITLLGIVHQVQTGSMDPTRYPFPYQKTEAELLNEQPQIFEFLKTTFSCTAVGYQENGTIFHLIPHCPPKIHAFVNIASEAIYRKFFSNGHYMHLLFSAPNLAVNVDELLLVIIKKLLQDKIITQDQLITIMQTYSLLTSNDYRRMKLILQRLQPLIGNPGI